MFCYFLGDFVVRDDIGVVRFFDGDLALAGAGGGTAARACPGAVPCRVEGFALGIGLFDGGVGTSFFVFVVFTGTAGVFFLCVPCGTK